MLRRKPRKGDSIRFRTLLPTGAAGELEGPTYEVLEVKDDGIVWLQGPEGTKPTCFIAWFKDGPNKLAELV